MFVGYYNISGFFSILQVLISVIQFVPFILHNINFLALILLEAYFLRIQMNFTQLLQQGFPQPCFCIDNC